MNYFTLLYRSFFDPSAYRHMHTNYRGSGFGYLFFLISIITLIYVACALYSTHQLVFAEGKNGDPSMAERFAEQVTRQMPEVTIKDGILSTTAPEPYGFDMTIEDETFEFAVIDTDADPKMLLEEDSPAILFTAEAVHVEDDRKIESFYYTELELEEGEELFLDAEISKAYTMQGLEWVEDNLVSNTIILLLIFWAFFVIIWLIWATIVGLIWALILKFIGYLMKHSLPYEDALRLTFLIITPAYVIQTVLANAYRAEGFKAMPGDGISLLLYIAIILLTSIFAIRSIRSE